MVIESTFFKKIVFLAIIYGVPSVLFGMSAVQRIDLGKKPSKSTSFEIMQNAAPLIEEAMRPRSPVAYVSPRRRAKIDSWTAQNPCIPGALPDDNDKSFNAEEFLGKEILTLGEDIVVERQWDGCMAVSGSRAVYGSGSTTPFQSLTFQEFVSSDSRPSSLSTDQSQIGILHKRLSNLESVVEDQVIGSSNAIVDCHKTLNNVLYASEDGKNVKKGSLIQWVCKALGELREDVACMQNEQQEFFNKKISALEKKEALLVSQLQVQENFHTSLVSEFKEKKEKIEILEGHITELMTQMCIMSAALQRQSRPWWKRCLSCCVPSRDMYENSENSLSEKADSISKYSETRLSQRPDSQRPDSQ